MSSALSTTWLLLIHQLPPQPAYLRVKIGRRLAKVGAVALKNSVYLLPENGSTLEDFQWIAREVAEAGGEVTLSSARFIEGLDDEGVRALFREARDAEYREVSEAARAAAAALGQSLGQSADGSGARREWSRLERRLEEVRALDFFQAPARNEAETALLDLRGRMEESAAPAVRAEPPEAFRGRTWVTRQGVEVDRIASAWLIRRFIDPAARFRFVPARGYRPASDELRFDMFDAEFTHEGDACTFEVLLRRLVPRGDVRGDTRGDALGAIADIVHDIDLKDGKFGRLETPGVARVLAGIAMAHAADEARLERGAALLDDLYASLGGAAAGPTSSP